MGLEGLSLEGTGVPDYSELHKNEPDLVNAPKQKEDSERADFDPQMSLNNRVSQAEEDLNGIDTFVPADFGEEIHNEQTSERDTEQSEKSEEENIIITKPNDEDNIEKNDNDNYEVNSIINSYSEAITAATEATSETEKSRIIKETHYTKSQVHLDSSRRRANEAAGEKTKEENGGFDSVIDGYDNRRGVEGFYEDYNDLVTANEGNTEKQEAGKAEIMGKLADSLGSAEKSKGVFEKLTDEESMRNYELSIRNRQLGKLAEIDEEKGTDHYDKIPFTKDPKNAPPIHTLHKLDEYFEEVAKIEGDQELMRLNGLGRATPMGKKLLGYGEYRKEALEKLYRKIDDAVNNRLDSRSQLEAVRILSLYSGDQGMIETTNELLYGDLLIRA